MNWMTVHGRPISQHGQPYGLNHAAYLLTENVAFFRRKLGRGFTSSVADELVADAMDAFGNYALALEADRDEAWELCDRVYNRRTA